jgi:hypothetical protein
VERYNEEFREEMAVLIYIVNMIMIPQDSETGVFTTNLRRRPSIPAIKRRRSMRRGGTTL